MLLYILIIIILNNIIILLFKKVIRYNIYNIIRDYKGKEKRKKRSEKILVENQNKMWYNIYNIIMLIFKYWTAALINSK